MGDFYEAPELVGEYGSLPKEKKDLNLVNDLLIPTSFDQASENILDELSAFWEGDDGIFANIQDDFVSQSVQNTNLGFSSTNWGGDFSLNSSNAVTFGPSNVSFSIGNSSQESPDQWLNSSSLFFSPTLDSLSTNVPPFSATANQNTAPAINKDGAACLRLSSNVPTLTFNETFELNNRVTANVPLPSVAKDTTPTLSSEGGAPEPDPRFSSGVTTSAFNTAFQLDNGISITHGGQIPVVNYVQPQPSTSTCQGTNVSSRKAPKSKSKGPTKRKKKMYEYDQSFADEKMEKKRKSAIKARKDRLKKKLETKNLRDRAERAEALLEEKDRKLKCAEELLVEKNRELKRAEALLVEKDRIIYNLEHSFANISVNTPLPTFL